jgi:predicted nucleotidyltransferase
MVKKEDDVMFTISRQDLARIEEYEVQWYEFFGCWVRMERSEHTDNDIMITVHPDEDSDYIGKLVVSNSYLGSKLEKL